MVFPRATAWELTYPTVGWKWDFKTNPTGRTGEGRCSLLILLAQAYLAQPLRSLDNQCCEVKEVSECGCHCPLLEGLASSPIPVFGSKSIVLNLLWILGSSKSLRKAMDSRKKKRYVLIHKYLYRVSRFHGKTPWNPPINFLDKGVTLEADRSKCQFRAKTPISCVRKKLRRGYLAYFLPRMPPHNLGSHI